MKEGLKEVPCAQEITIKASEDMPTSGAKGAKERASVQSRPS